MEEGIIILTGATGFVGQYVLKELLNKGITVHCLINNRSPVQQHKNLVTHKVNLLTENTDQLSKIFDEVKPTLCIHCAWYTNHKDYLTSTLNHDWLAASKRLIDLFYSKGGKRFVGLGTCIEYDLARSGLCNEDRTPLLGLTVYAQAKVALFKYLKSLNEQQQKDFAWSRIFFVYGPRDRKGRLIPYIFSCLSKNKEAKPYYGALKRDYIHVENLGTQIVKVAFSSLQGAVNVGTGKAVNIQSIFNEVGKQMNKIELIGQNIVGNPNDFPLILADMSKYIKEVGPLKNYDLSSGMSQTVEWMQGKPDFYL